MLEVHLCKPANYKLKILVEGGFKYYKSMGGTTKSGEDQIFKVQQGEARRGWEHNCSLKFSGEKTLEETMLLWHN